MDELLNLFLQGFILIFCSIFIVMMILLVVEVVNDILQTTLWIKFVTLRGRGRKKMKKMAKFKNLPNGRFYKIDKIINGRVAIVYFIKMNLGFKRMFKIYVCFPGNGLEDLRENMLYKKDGGKFKI